MEELSRFIRELVAEQLGTDVFADEENLYELGLDSIDLIVILSTVEEAFSTSGPRNDVLFRAEGWSVAELVSAVRNVDRSSVGLSR